ncbi:hypothetical protein IVB55_11145 [Bradyrhizobium sp. CW4]|uniref:hypothetical protein n=1 Tax=Bradyrhizobium sp. CW4 TaxID=2782687 RepID=UPI001FF867B2|nr:hypothetical protein [Bradyrhizobium sp. CW4]MCK1413533.1 hypothetical protein [Bradyrhizobium sp. CW4]
MSDVERIIEPTFNACCQHVTPLGIPSNGGSQGLDGRNNVPVAKFVFDLVDVVYAMPASLWISKNHRPGWPAQPRWETNDVPAVIHRFRNNFTYLTEGKLTFVGAVVD